MLSTLMTAMAIAPLLGPALGGQILGLAGWRAIFWTLVGVGLLTLAALFSLPETLPRDRREREPLSRAFVRYGELLRSRAVLGYAGAVGFFYVGTFAYVAGTPFAYIGYHHVPPRLYGVLFALGIVGVMAANLVNARLVLRLGGDRLLRAGTVMAALAGVGAAVAARTGWGGLSGSSRRCSASSPRPGSSPRTRSAARSPALLGARAPSQPWSAPPSTARASSAPRWSAPSPMARPGRWAG
jgi:DHA1 family bicyclomycin/chloramphenicol resistance-like MFS transporter